MQLPKTVPQARGLSTTIVVMAKEWTDSYKALEYKIRIAMMNHLFQRLNKSTLWTKNDMHKKGIRIHHEVDLDIHAQINEINKIW